jgi:hypothetical protein
MKLSMLLITFLTITSNLFAEDVGSAKNNFQCNGVPSELFSRCRMTIAADKPFFYGYIEEAEDCSTLADSAERQNCTEVTGRGNRFAIQTDEYEMQPRRRNPSKQRSAAEIQSAQMERIAGALERSALLATIQLVFIGVGTVATIALIALSAI